MRPFELRLNRHMGQTTYNNEMMKHHTVVKKYQRVRAMKSNARRVGLQKPIMSWRARQKEKN